MLGTMIKEQREQQAVSVAALAEQIQQPVELVMAWEAGEQLPRKRDLELVDRVLNTNLSTEVYKNLQYTRQIGNKTSVIKVVLTVFGVIFFDWMMTGFGRQPVYIFMIVLFLTAFITFPVFFSEYWRIDDNALTEVKYSDNFIVKTTQIINQKLRPQESFDFSEIDNVEIKYVLKTRESPVDIWPDYYNLIVNAGDKHRSIEINGKFGRQLIPTMLYLSSQNLIVKDPQKVLGLLENHKNLYEHFHSETPRQA